MNRLSFLRALGATLAAVPLGLMAARKSEPEATIDLSKLKGPVDDLFERSSIAPCHAESFNWHELPAPRLHDGKAYFMAIDHNLVLVYDADGYPRIVKA